VAEIHYMRFDCVIEVKFRR